MAEKAPLTPDFSDEPQGDPEAAALAGHDQVEMPMSGDQIAPGMFPPDEGHLLNESWFPGREDDWWG
ncbi:MAG TPA: hypothetical protein VL737_00090 [Candidatus Pristimantibacillus sp.]|nr:hypothetical protein [Candidatus Pristimantibacillus sp.]